MNNKVTVRQKNMLVNDLLMRRKEENYKDNVNDTITELYIDVPIGITKHGLTVRDICDILGISDPEDIRKMRSRVCQYAIEMIKRGFPFGGIKNSEKKMQYNFCSNQKEWQAIQIKKIKSIKKNAYNLMLHFDEEDLISHAGQKLLNECNKQLTLFE